MKWSTADRGQAASRTAGGGTGRGRSAPGGARMRGPRAAGGGAAAGGGGGGTGGPGGKDQNRRCSSVMRKEPPARGASPFASGQGAPRATQRVSRATSAS